MMELNHQQESQTVFDAEGCPVCVEVWPPVNDSQWWSFQKIGPDDLFLCMGLQQFSFVSLRVRFSGLPYPKRFRSTRDWHERSNEAFTIFPLFQSVIGAFKGNRSCNCIESVAADVLLEFWFRWGWKFINGANKTAGRVLDRWRQD